MIKDGLGNETKVLNDSSENETEDPRKTAYHETGHAIIHELFGWKYINITIKDNSGAVNVEYEKKITRNSSLMDQLIYGCICLSGYITANEYGRRLDSNHLDDVPYLCGDKNLVSDWDRYQSLSLLDYYIPLREFTKEIILENWLSITEIVCNLSRKKS